MSPKEEILENYFLFVFVVEVYYNEIWSKQCANFTEIFNVGLVPAVRPSSITDNWKGGCLTPWAMKCYC